MHNIPLTTSDYRIIYRRLDAKTWCKALVNSIFHSQWLDLNGVVTLAGPRDGNDPVWDLSTHVFSMVPGEGGCARWSSKWGSWKNSEVEDRHAKRRKISLAWLDSYYMNPETLPGELEIKAWARRVDPVYSATY